jgi:hypothetical protein
MHLVPVNWLAILVAVVIRMAVGTLWYSPVMFVKPWQALTGVTPDSMRAGMGKAIGVDLVMSLLMALVLQQVAAGFGVTDPISGVFAAVHVWVGFVVATALPLWGYENRPLKLIAINSGHNLVALVLMGAAFGLIR